MARRSRTAGRASPADVEAEVARIAAMSVDELRAFWSASRAAPPPAVSKDLLARVLTHELQEKRFGGLRPQTKRLLAGHGAGAPAPARRLKPGAVLTREHQGVLHQVTVVADGFSWRGACYPSLSAIARAITGVNWSGPRFFGISGAAKPAGEESSPDAQRRAPSSEASP